VKYAEDFDGVYPDSIRKDVGRAGNDELACAGYAAGTAYGWILS
jgi:hypothetical protein